MQLLHMHLKQFRRAGQSLGLCGLFHHSGPVHLSPLFFFLSGSLQGVTTDTQSHTHILRHTRTQGCWEHEARTTGTVEVISGDSFTHSHSDTNLPAHKHTAQHTPTQMHMQAQSVRMGRGDAPGVLQFL